MLHSSFCLRVQGQSYTIDWYKIAGGGGTSTGATYQVTGTIGQPDASGAMSGGQYSVTGGFWSLILWPDPATNTYTLQQNANLAAVNGWTTSGYSINPANGTNSVTVTPSIGNLFFRLAKP